MYIEKSRLDSKHFSKKFSQEKNDLKTVNELGKRLIAEDITFKEKQDVQMEIIESFHNYLTKYTELVKYGKVNLTQKDSFIFLSLFASKVATASNKYEALRRVAARMPVTFFDWEIEDIYNELVVVLLEVAQKYSNIEVGFTYYLQTFFRYAVKQWITKKWHDAHIYCDAKLEMDAKDLINSMENFEIRMNYNRLPKDLLDLNYLEDFGLGKIEYSEKWIFSCNETPFSSMSISQRQIIYRRFGLKENFASIEKSLCISRKDLKKEIEHIILIIKSPPCEAF